MQVLVYAPSFSLGVRNLLESLDRLEPAVQCQHLTSLDMLAEVLRKPMGVPCMGILIPDDGEALSALVDCRHLLRDMRIIVVLPDNQLPTITTAHLLRPRYIGYSDGDFYDVVAVMSRMVRNLTQPQPYVIGCSPEALAAG